MSRLNTTTRRPGDRFSVVQDLNRLAAAVDGAQIEVTGGGLATRGPGNISLFIPRQSSTTAILPFDVLFTSTGVTTQFRLYPGTVNGLLPSNIFTDVTFTGTGTEYIKLACVSDTFRVTAVDVTCNSTAPVLPAPTQNAAPASFDILVAVLVNGALFQIWEDNAIARPLLTYMLAKTAPTPGQPAFDLYYSWEIAAATPPAV